QGGAARVVAQHGWAAVAPVPCVEDEPSGHESRLASQHPSLLTVGPVRQQNNEVTAFSNKTTRRIASSSPILRNCIVTERPLHNWEWAGRSPARTERPGRGRRHRARR